MVEDHDLGTTLDILDQNLQQIDDADNREEMQTAISNYLSSVNTLAVQSLHFAEGELDEWLVQQKREELLDEIER